MQNVNISDAREYVTEHFAKQGCPVTIHSADYNEEHGLTAVDVLFSFKYEKDACGDCVMTVWYEAGSSGPYLYGEW